MGFLGSVGGWAGQLFAWLFAGTALFGAGVCILASFIAAMILAVAGLGLWLGFVVGASVPILFFGMADGFSWRAKRS